MINVTNFISSGWLKIKTILAKVLTVSQMPSGVSITGKIYTTNTGTRTNAVDRAMPLYVDSGDLKRTDFLVPCFKSELNEEDSAAAHGGHLYMGGPSAGQYVTNTGSKYWFFNLGNTVPNSSSTGADVAPSISINSNLNSGYVASHAPYYLPSYMAGTYNYTAYQQSSISQSGTISWTTYNGKGAVLDLGSKRSCASISPILLNKDDIKKIMYYGCNPGWSLGLFQNTTSAEVRIMSSAKGNAGRVWPYTQQGMHRLIPITKELADEAYSYGQFRWTGEGTDLVIHDICDYANISKKTMFLTIINMFCDPYLRIGYSTNIPCQYKYTGRDETNKTAKLYPGGNIQVQKNCGVVFIKGLDGNFYKVYNGA